MLRPGISIIWKRKELFAKGCTNCDHFKRLLLSQWIRQPRCCRGARTTGWVHRAASSSSSSLDAATCLGSSLEDRTYERNCKVISMLSNFSKKPTTCLKTDSTNRRRAFMWIQHANDSPKLIFNHRESGPWTAKQIAAVLENITKIHEIQRQPTCCFLRSLSNLESSFFPEIISSSLYVKSRTMNLAENTP